MFGISLRLFFERHSQTEAAKRAEEELSKVIGLGASNAFLVVLYSTFTDGPKLFSMSDFVYGGNLHYLLQVCFDP